MKTTVRTRQVGGSLMVTLPANIVKEKRIMENDMVEIDIQKVRKDFFGAARGIGPFNEEDKLKGQLE